MPFVQGKCESCGGILTVDPSLKAANCPFCGAAYVVQDSINYYNTTIKVDNLHADVVNVSDESSSEGRLKAAEAYMKLEQYEQAEKEYRQVTEIAPQNHLGWLGLIDSHTYNYTKRIKSASEIKSLKEYAKSVRTLAPSGNGEKLLSKFTDYINTEENQNSAEIKNYELELSEFNKKLKPFKVKRKDLKAEIESIEEQISDYQTKLKKFKINSEGPKIFLRVLGVVLFAIGVYFMINLYDGDKTVAVAVGLAFMIPGVVSLFIPLLINVFNAIRRAKIERIIEQLANNRDSLLEELTKVREQIRLLKESEPSSAFLEEYE